MKILENRNRKQKNHIGSHMQLPLCGKSKIKIIETLTIDSNTDIKTKFKYNVCANCWKKYIKYKLNV